MNPPKSPQCNSLKGSILSNSSLKAIGCYPLKDNLPSLITFQEMNNVVHQELNTLQNLGTPMTILDVIMCFNGDHNKIYFNISSRVQANMEELERAN